MPFGPLIPVVILIMIMLQGCTPNRKNKNKDNNEDDPKKDEETYTEEECTDAVKETEVLEETECTSDARVMCTRASEDSQPIYLIKNGSLVYISDIKRLIKTDVELDGHFMGCIVDGECSVSKKSIEGGKWQDYNEGDDEGEDMETLNRDNSYMLCTNCFGLIYFVDDGQKIQDNEYEILESFNILHISDQGIQMIANFELSEEVIESWGLGEFDENKNLIGIYPYYVFKKDENKNYISDGGITFGFGHWVSEGVYKASASDKELVDQYALGASFTPPYISTDGKSYKVTNSLYISVEKAQELLMCDLLEAEIALNKFLMSNSVNLNQNQFDALVSFTHQYGANWWMKDKVMPKFIREGKGNYDPKDVREKFAEHDYKERRSVEAEVFINGY